MTQTESARPPEVFSARVAIILFLVGVFSFSAFITLSTFAPDVPESDARAHALSRSAIGYAGIVKLARAAGAIVGVSRTRPEVQSRPAFVILTPGSKLTFEEADRLAGQAVLVVLPKWLGVPSFDHPGWVMESIPMSEASVADVLDEIAPKAKVTRQPAPFRPVLNVDWKETRSPTRGDAIRPGKIASLQTISTPDLTPVMTTRQGETVLGVIRGDDSPDIYVLSEPDLLNTQGIADLDTARAGMALLDTLRAPGEPITFDVTLNGYARSRNLLRLALEPPLLAATLSFLLVAALIAWRAATREGPTIAPGRALAYGKRTLADNSAALIRLAGRDHKMAGRYADLVRTLVAERIGAARDGNETTSAELDRIAETRGVPDRFSDLAARAVTAQTGAQAVSAARRLHTWTEEMIRATR
jgi:hypothetical protein